MGIFFYDFCLTSFGVSISDTNLLVLNHWKANCMINGLMEVEAKELK